MSVKNAIMKAIVEGTLVELMVKSNVENIFVDDNTTLAAKLSEIIENINDIGDVDAKISTAIDNLIGGAPETYNTLKEIADYIATHQDEYSALIQTIAGKVDKVEGKGLSTEDFTSELKAKLDAIAEGANKYELPVATASILGGVKVGTNLTVAEDGTLSAVDTTYEEATTTAAGLMSAADKVELAAKAKIYAQSTQPTELKEGELWIQVAE